MKSILLIGCALLSGCYQISATGSHAFRVNTLTGKVQLCNIGNDQTITCE